MYRKLALLAFTLLTALLMGVAGAGAAITKGTTPTTGAGSGQTSSSTDEPLMPVGSGFTYQGRLTNGGSAANGLYDLNFLLWDAAIGGTQLASSIAVSNHVVSDGHFTVSLDFGASAFQGSARWLEIAVRPAGIGAFTMLAPRQPLTPAPYAMSLMPGAMITGTLLGPILSATNTGIGPGVYGTSTSGYGVQGRSIYGDGVYGTTSDPENAGVFGTHAGTGSAIRGENNSSSRAAIYGINSGSGPSILGQGTSNTGVAGYSASGAAVYAESNTAYGVYALSANGDAGVYSVCNTNGGRGVVGEAPAGTGVSGHSTSGTGVYGVSSTGNGAIGQSTSSAGVSGSSSTGSGVHGESSSGSGVRGVSTGGNSYQAGVYGVSNTTSGNGVIGEANNGSNAFGVWGKSTNGYAGYFSGKVHVNGTLSKSAGSFKIDHPLDPANKYLSHSFVESPDMMNIYNGNVTTDAKGGAVVTMPDWFETLNGDFRYQLTIVGDQFAQARVSSKMNNNRFTIKTDKPNIEVSWQVTGIRHDPYAEQHRIPVEQEKTANERGYYLQPELYNQPSNKAMENSR